MCTADCASVPACLLFLGFSSTEVFLHRYLCSREDAAFYKEAGACTVMLMQGGENLKPGPEAASSLTDAIVQCCCLVLGLEWCPEGIRVLQYQDLMGPA